MPPTEAAGGHLVVASYNVHRCVGVDARERPDRVAAVLRELGAAIVALQEVEGGEDASDQFRALAEATGLTAIPGPTLAGERGDYGNALLTSLPVKAVRRHDLSLPGREPRGAIDALLDAGGLALRVVATHLGLGRRERREQVRRLLGALAAEAHEPLLLMGDMNEWNPASRALSPLHGLLGPTPSLRTFPSRLPLLPLDRIWATPRSALVNLSVHRSAKARVASDHLPLRADLVLERAGEPR